MHGAGGVQAVAGRHGRQRVLHRAPRRPQGPEEPGGHHRRGDAVLVQHPAAHRVAERLLVAEHEAELGVLAHGPHHPLEPGRRLDVPGAVRCGDAAHQARRHVRGDDQAVGTRVPGGEQVLGEQRAQLVAAEHAPGPVGPHRRRQGEAVGVGIVGQHRVGPHLCCGRERQVQGAGLLGVGVGRRGEGAVGSGLCRHQVRPVETGTVERREEQVRADAVQRGVDEHGRPVHRCRRERGDHVLEVARHRLVVDGVHPFGHPRRRGCQRVGGEHRRLHRALVVRVELRAGGGVDLHAAVGRWVVGRGAHDARVEAAVPHEVRHEGCGRRTLEQVHRAAGGAEHVDELVGEGLGPDARVAADGDLRTRRQPRRQPPGDAADREAVQPCRARATPGAEPRRADADRVVEPAGDRDGVAARRQGGRQLLTRRGIGVGLDPGPGTPDQVTRVGGGRRIGHRAHGPTVWPARDARGTAVA